MLSHHGQMAVNDRQFRRAGAHHLARHRADGSGIFRDDPVLQWIFFHNSKIIARDWFGRYAMFSFRACRDPRARRGIWKKCCRAFWILDVAGLSLDWVGSRAWFVEKPEFLARPQVWRCDFS